MKEINVTLYTFEELAPEVRNEIINKNRQNITECLAETDSEDYRATLDAFTNIFNIDTQDDGYVLFCRRVNDAEDPHATGLHAARYFRSKYNELAKGKYFYTPGKYINGKYISGKSRNSKVTFKTSPDELFLTGVYSDYELLKNIYPYVNGSKVPGVNESIYDVINNALRKFSQEWDRVTTSYDTKYITEEYRVMHEDTLYFENGEIYKGVA